MKKLHLIANAHIDPIWLWEWEEGAAAAVSTFRSAAKLAEEFDYIFCHNEVTLYKWVQNYEPVLFEQIKKLVKQGRWHIMGGWYLQPDCNMPSGESLVRQMKVGKEYFIKEFGVYPKTAMNVDPFGHSVGLVQILKKCGFENYIYCRPLKGEQQIDDDAFLWTGLDGSVIQCLRVEDSYNNLLGKADEKIRNYIEKNKDREFGLVMWGVGNHGGGPSRLDLTKIAELMKHSDTEIVHSTPDSYFADRTNFQITIDKSLYPSMVGCYSSQALIKQKHRELENQYYMTEKMCAAAHLCGLIEYPETQLKDALEDLLNAQFHDILPGTSIKAGENAGIRLMEHGLEILTRLRASAFFALASGQEQAKPGEYPILVFNPHPYKITKTVEVEFQLEDQNWGEDITTATVYQEGQALKTQLIKEASNLNLDWRKRIIFTAELAPFSMNRFDCKVHRVPRKAPYPFIENDFCFDNGSMKVTISKETGLIREIVSGGFSYVRENAFLPVIIDDTNDPWAMSKTQALEGLGPVIDSFTLMDDKRASEFIGLKNIIPALHIIEDGDVMTVLEAVFEYHDSQIIVHTILHKTLCKIEMNYTVFWNEKDKALKLSIPMNYSGTFEGEIVFGREVFPTDGKEVMFQRWCNYYNENNAFAISNTTTYAGSAKGTELYLTLLRSPCYSGHQILDRSILPNDRYSPRIDQGERHFSFELSFGDSAGIHETIARTAQTLNETPYPLNLFPHGMGEKHDSVIELSDNSIQLVTFKKSDNNSYILRLFNSTAENRSTVIKLSKYELEQELCFSKFEVKTLRLLNGKLSECEEMDI